VIQETATIVFKVGLHARPAGKFVKLAKSFPCSIKIKNLTRGGEEVDAKSLVKVIKIACAHQHHVQLTLEGEEEDKARDAILAFLADPSEDE
jgi:phosphotransferase system HPr (HPr) family protein